MLQWSLIDSFVLTMMMVAFHFHLELADPAQVQPSTVIVSLWMDGFPSVRSDRPISD
jgi:hypothetical protein